MFLRKGVPEPLRNAALRRMWSLDPNIRDFVSEAREYAYDWNTPGGVPGSGALPASEEVARMAARIVGGSGVASDEELKTSSNDREQPASPQDVQAGAPEAVAAPGSEKARGSNAEDRTSMVVPPSPAIEKPPQKEDAIDQNPMPEPASAAPAARRHGGAMPL
jgi:hypothetical protein